MAGIYIHFPFCKKACTYCNFHFSTSLNYQKTMVESMLKEIDLRKSYLGEELIDSIYFGGGSPSLLSAKLIGEFILKIKKIFNVSETVEITLEMNPDDSSTDYLLELKENKVNRLSLGVQSFFDDDLKLINRIHSANDAIESLNKIKDTFNNFSIDLIYGLPYSDIQKWEYNLKTALKFEPPHISSYALTVENKTVLKKQVDNGNILLIDESLVEEQYFYMIDLLEKKNYDNYEFSNFAFPKKHSVNNNGYWKGNPYLGIGPSAHSFNGKNKRSWNLKNNKLYIKSIKENKLLFDEEKLSLKDRFNEIVMTGLRTSSGISLKTIREKIGDRYADFLEKTSEKRVISNDLYWDADSLHVSKKSKFISDGIASDLFLINL
ncbi:MAG: coproporphyrinogen III oxidase [Flavobacteriaceae bacterium]|nr:coproporphyrinogen III oxidase [Flavobacteriaceae bacterium]